MSTRPTYRCSKCGSDELRIETAVIVTLDGEVTSDIAPQSNDLTVCSECETEGPLESFEVKPAVLCQEIADAINQVIATAWDDEIERYEEDERPAFHSFEALVILENWLRGTSKTANEFADQAAKEKAGW